MVKIVVFDSGFGSLSVIKQIRKHMKAQVIYFADQKNFPYGKKSISLLRKIIFRTIDSLQNEFEPDIIIVGSNTPSILLDNFKHGKIIGVYPPLKEASQRTKTDSIAILSTQNVAKSKALDKLIKTNISKKINVLKINASPLVELVESAGKFIENKELCAKKIKLLLEKKLLDNQIDVVTLSSTHLPFLLPLLKQIFPKISFLDPAENIVKKIMIKHKSKSRASLKIFTSGNVSQFQKQLHKIGIHNKVIFKNF